MNKKILSLFALGVALRVLLIWNAPLWYDENFTLVLSRLPFDQMINATAADVHPPLSYILFWLVGQVGAPAWALRIVSLVFSVASLWLFRKISKNEIALTIMALSPFQLWFAQEARMYTMLAFFVLLGFYAVTNKKWWLYLLAGVGMVYSHNYGVFYVATLFIYAIMYERWALYSGVSKRTGEIITYLQIAKTPHSLRAIYGTTAIALAWLPWAFVVMGQANSIDGAYWIMRPTPGAVIDLLTKLVWGFVQPQALVSVSVMITTALIAVGLYLSIQKKAWSVLILAFAPLLMALFVSLVWNPILLHRPLIGSAPFLYIIIAQGADLLTTPRRRLYAAAFILPLVLANLAGYYHNTPGVKVTARTIEAREYFRDHATPDDIVYHTGDGSIVNWMAYLPDLNHVRMPDCGAERGKLTPETRRAMGIPVQELAETNPARVWIVAAKTPLQPQCYFDQLDHLLDGAELVIQVDDNELIESGVWLK